MADTRRDGFSLWNVIVFFFLICCLEKISDIEKQVATLTKSHDARLGFLEACEKRDRPGPGPLELRQFMIRMKDVERRVLTPRFGRHCAGCAQCRGDVPSEEGGPSPLCRTGFELMKEDLREKLAEAAENGPDAPERTPPVRPSAPEAE